MMGMKPSEVDRRFMDPIRLGDLAGGVGAWSAAAMMGARMMRSGRRVVMGCGGSVRVRGRG